MMTGASESGNLIIYVAEKIQELGQNYYKQTAEWEQYPLRVERLRVKLEQWERESRNRGSSSHASLAQLLDVARLCLEEEHKKINRRKGACGSKCWRQVGRTVFPAQVGQRIQAAIEAFDNIQRMLESQDLTNESFDRILRSSPFPETITADTRYVPLKESEAKLYDALDREDGPLVVLLHGGAGKGKSTVARNTVFHYSDRKTRFEHVFLLNCGPDARVEETQCELICLLGSQPFARRDDGDRARSISIRKQVKALLAERRILIVLDDVSDEELLRKVVELCGSGVKCLITSRLGSLCRSLDSTKYTSIEIQELDQEGARKILASHSGLPSHQIPAHLQRLADDLIAETDRNPLALASLASVIDPRRSQELGEWEDAFRNIFQALQSEVPAAIFNGKYPRSLWATMGLAISSLRDDARKLLLLTHTCRVSSVPEEVIRILCTSTKLLGDSAAPFSILRRELESRQLIKISTRSFSSNSCRKQRTWRMHSLQKKYIDQEMRDARDSIFGSLAVARTTVTTTVTSRGQGQLLDGQLESDAVPTALCALYLNEHLAGKAAASIGVPLEVFSKRKRAAIEPLTRLLALSVSDRWTATARGCATQVFLRYVCTLEELTISELLTHPTGAILMYFIPLG